MGGFRCGATNCATTSLRGLNICCRVVSGHVGRNSELYQGLCWLTYEGDSHGAEFLTPWRGEICAMAAAVRLGDDYSAEMLRALARRSKDANQSRRLLSLAVVRDGMDRRSAAKIGGMDRQTLRDWVHRFNSLGPEGLIDNWTEGPKPRLSEDQLAEFARIVEAGPDRERDGVVRWRRIDLKRVIAERFGVDFHPRYVGKLLKKLGFSHMSARPRHPAQDGGIVRRLKKLPTRAEGSSRGLPRRRRWKSGLKTRPGSARRTALSANGPGVERGQGSPPTSAMTTPICSAPSVPPVGSGRARAALRRHRHDAASPRRNLA